jgi:hypothetical protein
MLKISYKCKCTSFLDFWLSMKDSALVYAFQHVMLRRDIQFLLTFKFVFWSMLSYIVSNFFTETNVSYPHNLWCCWKFLSVTTQQYDICIVRSSWPSNFQLNPDEKAEAPTKLQTYKSRQKNPFWSQKNICFQFQIYKLANPLKQN